MRRQHEALLVAALSGVIIAGAAAFAVQPVAPSHTQRSTLSLTSIAVLNQLQGPAVSPNVRPLLPPSEG
jgi:uncharacterized membrane protein YadS